LAIYCRYKTLTAQEMLEIILKQLILCCPEVDTENLRKLKDQGRRLSLDDIVTKLKALSDRIPNIFIVIDAFDECFSEQTRHHVLSLLQSLSFIKILITSRPLPSIASAMTGIPTLIISAHEQDIKIHFQFLKCNNPRLSRLLPEHPDIDVEGKIVNNADGM
jgi:exopolysaccharide biosynthesis predicted pyruvyltransferase EpsI